MLTSISFNNYRNFRNFECKLPAITVLVGPNSSGKSSIHKFIELMSGSTIDILNFSNGSHKLGSFKNILCDKNKTLDVIWKTSEVYYGNRNQLNYWYNPLQFYASYSPSGNEDGELVSLEIKSTETLLSYKKDYHNKYLELNFHLSNFVNKVRNKTKVEEIEYIDLSTAEATLNRFSESILSDEYSNSLLTISKDVNTEDVKTTLETEILRNLSIVRVSLDQNSILYPETYNDFGVLDFLDEGLNVWLSPNSAQSIWERKLDTIITNEHLRYILTDMLQEPISSLINPEFAKIIHLYVFSEALKTLKNGLIDFVNISNVGTQKARSERIYSNSGDTLSLLLLRLSKKPLINDQKYFLDQWLKVFEVGDELLLNRTEGVASETRIRRGTQTINLADLGFGYTQLITIILELCMNDPASIHIDRKLVILEEPEINLHPNLQSKLADLFWDAYSKFNIKLIIETHSEYMLRKFQLLVANRKANKSSILIYYFEKSGDFVRSINIHEDGRLSANFGSGFFDESDKIALDLFILKQEQQN